MVFHIAGAVDVFGFGRPALELVKDRAVRFLHDVGQHGQAPTVRHADDDFFDAKLTAAFDDLFHRRDQGFAAIKAEPLGPHVFYMQEFFEPFGLYQRVQDRFTPVLRKGDFLAVAFDPFFKPTGLFRIGDVHVLQRKCAAIRAAHDGDDLVHRCDFEAQHIVDKDRAIHVGSGEAVRFWVKFRVRFQFAHAQRVEIGNQVPTNAVGSNDHQRADAIKDGVANLLFVKADTFFSGFCSDLFTSCFWFNGPLTIKRCCQVVVWNWRPITACP